MSTRRTLWWSEQREYSLYEETLEGPILNRPLTYPVHLEVATSGFDIDLRLPDDLSVKLVEAFNKCSNDKH